MSDNGSAAAPMIEAIGLSKFYGPFAATKDVTFEVPRGQVAAFLGRTAPVRPETIESGSNMLSGADTDMIGECVRNVTELKNSWDVPREYLVENVSATAVKIVKGYNYIP